MSIEPLSPSLYTAVKQENEALQHIHAHNIEPIENSPLTKKAVAVKTFCFLILNIFGAAYHAIAASLRFLLGVGHLVFVIPFSGKIDSAAQNVRLSAEHIKKASKNIFAVACAPVSLPIYAYNTYREREHSPVLHTLGWSPTRPQTSPSIPEFSQMLKEAQLSPELTRKLDAALNEEGRKALLAFYKIRREKFGPEQLKMVLKGYRLLEQIKKGEAPIETDPEMARRNLLSLMWCADVDSILIGEGSRRCMHCCQDEAARLFIFIKNTADHTTGRAYKRPSTHYSHLVSGDQYGVDIDGLPGGMRTILFGRRSDQPGHPAVATFFKMEEYGAAFLSSRSFTMLADSFSHIGTTLDTQVLSPGQGGRKEKVPRPAQKVLKKIFGRKNGNAIISNGVQAMHSALQKANADPSKTISDELRKQANAMQGYLEARIRLDQQRGITINRAWREIIHHDSWSF